jgi:acetamidase/formamidase
MPAQQHFLDASIVHYEWNNAIPPRLDVNPGDTVVFETRDASDEFYNLTSTHDDVMRRVFKGHPLTGPVRIRGARPGDVLAVEIIDITPRASFGWTNVRPGRGLLPESEFGTPFLQLWDVTDGRFARGLFGKWWKRSLRC